MFVFSTPLYTQFAKQLTRKAKLRIGRVDTRAFSDGEIYVRVPQKIHQESVLVIGTTAPPADNLVQLLLLVSALRSAGAKKVIALIPYFGYGRADRTIKEGDAVSAEIMAKLLETAGVDRVITIQIHSTRVLTFFRIPITNIVPYEVMAAVIEKYWRQVKGPLAIVAPDHGAYDMARHIAQMFNVQAAWLDKRRPKPNLAVVHTLHGNVDGKNIVLVDDMIDTAGTIVAAGQFLKRRHHAGKIGVVAIHGILSGPACNRLRASFIKKVIVTDTIPPVGKKIKSLPHLEMISMIPSLVRVLNKLKFK